MAITMVAIPWETWLLVETLRVRLGTFWAIYLYYLIIQANPLSIRLVKAGERI